MIGYFCGLIYVVYTKLLKWLLWVLTGKCELLRIVLSKNTQQRKVVDIEKSLQLSKFTSLRNILDDHERSVVEMAGHIAFIKRINLEKHTGFIQTMGFYLSLIIGYKDLINEIDQLRKTPYSKENEAHEKLLLMLWHELQPNEELTSRKSKQWESLGFQGSDPATDFRGMGLLGLHCLLYLASNHKETARYMLSQSLHPLYGYSFAIVGINMTSLSFQLLVRGKLKNYFYANLKTRPFINDFYFMFVHLFYEFSKFWISGKPKSIMEFEGLRNKFEEKIITDLQSCNVMIDFI